MPRLSSTASAFACCVVAVLSFAPRATAAPPQGEFPAALFPEEASSVPSNFRVFAFGKNAPSPSDIGLVLRFGSGPVEGDIQQFGCCLLVLRPAALLPEGEATTLLSFEGTDLEATFSVEAGVDDTPPTLQSVFVIDDRPGALVAAFEASDDGQVVGALARLDGELVQSAPVGTLLEMRDAAAGSCFEVTALDIAGNESEPVRVCDQGAGDDGGVQADGGPTDEPEPEPVGCSATVVPTNGAASPLFAMAAFFLLCGFRSRRHARILSAVALVALGATACATGEEPDAGIDDAGTIDRDAGAGDDAGQQEEGAVSTLASMEAYTALQSDDGKVRYLASVEGREDTSPVDDGCRFQDNAVYEYHLEYLRAELGDAFTLDDYTAMTLDRPTRVWWGGELWWRPLLPHPITGERGVLLYLVYATDDAQSALTADDVREAHAVLQRCAPAFEETLAFTPGSLSQRQMAESEQASLRSDGIGVVVNPS